MASKDKKKLRYLEKEINKYNNKKNTFDTRLQELERRKSDLEMLLGKIDVVSEEPMDSDFITQCQTVKGHLEALVVTLDQVINEHKPSAKPIVEPKQAAAPTTTTPSAEAGQLDLTAILQMLNKPEIQQLAEVVKSSLKKG